MTGIHFILLFLPRKSIRGRRDILSHSLIMIQWSLAVSCLLSGFHSSAGAPGNEEAKAILQILGYSRKTTGEQRTSCTHSRTPTQRALGTELLMGLFLRLLQRQWPMPNPSQYSLLYKARTLKDTLSVYKVFSHTNLWDERLESLVKENIISFYCFCFNSDLWLSVKPYWTCLCMNYMSRFHLQLMAKNMHPGIGFFILT